MIARNRLAGTASSLSTDLTANDVRRFMARGVTLASRPAVSERRSSTGAPASLQDLYPSLYAVRVPAARRGVRGLRALAAGLLSRDTVLETN